ncbi:FtsX-like permease family protein [Klenkia soli]|uniref:FtsX-like permease family protein n=1 Tax=Klenkia soli TaxID=1052260 RepID=A0A1H0RPN0_9ACTN|nr:FtsX-like permease family protein [Klenkia soli]SDP31501.1 FtsX-like permease family protein [Klenkia soli]
MSAGARSRVQLRLLGVVLVVLVAGLTVLAGCVLLLTTGADRARQAALGQAAVDDTTVQVVLTDLGDDPGPAVEAAGGALTAALAPVAPGTSTWLTSTVRDVPPGADGGRRLGWLAGIDDLTARADLVAGTWPGVPEPGAPWPAALPVAAADALGLAPGDTVVLDPTTGLADAAATAPVTVQLVGLVQPRAGAWAQDRLAGAGAVPDLEFGVFGGTRLPAAGPFLVDPATLLAAGPGLEQVALVAAPDVAAASPAAVDRITDELGTLTRDVRAAVSGGPATSRVVNPLAATLAAADARLATGRTAVLAAGLLAVLLTVVALGTAARVLGDRRLAETALLRARGATGPQLARRALPEAALLVGSAAVLAVPLAVVATRAALADRLPGSDPGPLLPAGLLGAVAAGVVVLVALLAVGATRAATPGRTTGRGAVARSGADLLLVGLAVVAVLSLGGTVGTDPLLVVAPALVLLAGCALSLRLPPRLAHLADRRAARGRALAPVLVAGDLARRSLAGGATALLVLATAAAVAAGGIGATWSVSQADQADLRVGADLAVPAVGGIPGPVVAAAGGGAVSPVVARPVALGSLLRDEDGDATRLVAVDTTAGVLRGRLPGTDWAGATAGLPAGDPEQGVPLSGGSVVVTGTAAGTGLTAVLTLVLADPTGARTTTALPAVPLDGLPRSVVVDGDGTVVAVAVDLAPGPDDDPDRVARVDLAVTLPGSVPGWVATLPRGQQGADQLLSGLEAVDGGIGFRGRLVLGALPPTGQRVLLTPSRAPDAVPVLLSAGLADDLGADVGDDLSMAVGDTGVPVEVAGVVPDVPSVPGGPAVLADAATLARVLVAAGDLDVAPQAWWVAAPDPGAVGALAAAGLPDAVTRAGLTADLRGGPLAVGLPLGLALLGAGAVLLAVTGSVLQAGAVRSGRRAEVARLLGLGVPRATVRAVLLLQHGIGTVVGVLLGAVVGVVGTVLVGPALTGSPVPSAEAQFPWSSWTALVVGLAVLGTAVVLPVVRGLLRVDVAGALREGGS